MSPLNISDEEREAIRKQHEDATKKFYENKNAMEGGLKKPEEKPKEESMK